MTDPEDDAGGAGRRDPRRARRSDSGAAPGGFAGALDDLAASGTRLSEREPTREAVLLAVLADLPVLLWGEPGTGKSAAVLDVARAAGLPCEVVIASIREPSDFAGLPVIQADGGVRLAPPAWALRLNEAGEGVVFFDELSSAPPAVQSALLRVVLERQVGDTPLSPGVRVLAAANPASTAADGWDLAPPLANRFVHLDWLLHPDVVLRGLAGAWPAATALAADPSAARGSLVEARALVTAFLGARPHLVHDMPIQAADRGRAWPSPRTWDMAVRALATASAAGASAEATGQIVCGCVGEGAGIELMAYRESLDLVDPEQLLADPATFDLPGRGDLALAVLAAVTAAVLNDLTEQRWVAAWRVVVRAVEAGTPDLAARAAIDLAAARDPSWPAPPELEQLLEVLTLSGVGRQG